MRPFEGKIKEIAQLTEDNCHSEALIEIASFMFLCTGNESFKKLAEVFDWILMKIDERCGADCHKLLNQREDLKESMFSLMEKLGYSSTAEAFKKAL